MIGLDMADKQAGVCIFRLVVVPNLWTMATANSMLSQLVDLGFGSGLDFANHELPGIDKRFELASIIDDLSSCV